MSSLTATEVRRLDPYALLAVLGKRVIHPGGKASTHRLLEWAQVQPQERVLDIGCGVATTAVRLAKECHVEVVAADIPSLMRERAERNVRAAGLSDRVQVEEAMAWLMPRMSRAVPYLGYIIVHATKPTDMPTEAGT